MNIQTETKTRVITTHRGTASGARTAEELADLVFSLLNEVPRPSRILPEATGSPSAGENLVIRTEYQSDETGRFSALLESLVSYFTDRYDAEIRAGYPAHDENTLLTEITYWLERMK